MLVGRILLALVFLVSGWSKLTGFAAASGFVGTVLPAPELVTALAIIIELGGAILLIIGYQARYIAAILAVFALTAAFVFHLDFNDQIQLTQFLKDLAIAGGLLYVTATGAGAGALKKRPDSESV